MESAVPVGGQMDNILAVETTIITHLECVQREGTTIVHVDETTVCRNGNEAAQGAVEVCCSDQTKVSEIAPAALLFVESTPPQAGREQPNGISSAVVEVRRLVTATAWQLAIGCKSLLTPHRSEPHSAICIPAIIQAASQDLPPIASDPVEEKDCQLQKSSISEASVNPSQVGDSPSTDDGQPSEDVEIVDPGQVNRCVTASVPGSLLPDKLMVAEDGAFVRGTNAAVSTSSRQFDDADSQVSQKMLSSPDGLQNVIGGSQKPIQANALLSTSLPANAQAGLQSFPLERSDDALGMAERGPSPQCLNIDELIVRVADKFRDDKDEPLTLREVLRTGDLQGQAVSSCQLGHVSTRGVITSKGHICCHCSQCNGLKDLSAREFKEHAGCHDALKRPEVCIFLSSLNMTLKDFMRLVEQDLSGPDTHEMLCYVCHDGGDLLCCDGCPRVGHVSCVGLSDVPEDEWYCRRCQTGVDTDVQERTFPLSPAAVEGPTLMSPAAPYVSPQGRVHMSAPSARSCGVRRERNTNKHKRLFEYGASGALQDGERVIYRTTQGEDLLTGVVRISRDPNQPSGIVCGCCQQLISCSQFECHAGKGSRRAPYDSIVNADGVTLRRMAELMPATEEESDDSPTPFQFGRARRRRVSQADPGSLEGVSTRCTTLVEDLEEVYGGCRICHSHDFQRNFGARTMLICEQCEQEYHVQCLKNKRGETYDQNSEEAWFCSKECMEILSKLSAAVNSGFMRLGEKYCMQLLHGLNHLPAVENSLVEAAGILQESFDPIMDKANNQDLIPAMVHSEGLGSEWDFHGVFTVLLFHEGMSVCAAVCRAFGTILVEVPLVATRAAARRQGHARVLMRGLEMFFSHLGVERLTLPAAPAAINTWIMGFDFKPMEDAELRRLTEDTKMLIFPGTRVLHKKLPEAPTEVPTYLPAGEFTKKPFAPQAERPLAEGEGLSAPTLDGSARTVPTVATASGNDVLGQGFGTRGRGRGRGRGSRGRGPGRGRSLRHIPSLEGSVEPAAGTTASFLPSQTIGSSKLAGRAIGDGAAGDGGRGGTIAPKLSMADPQDGMSYVPHSGASGDLRLEGSMQPGAMPLSEATGHTHGRGRGRGRRGRTMGLGRGLMQSGDTQPKVTGNEGDRGQGWKQRKRGSGRFFSKGDVVPKTDANQEDQGGLSGPPGKNLVREDAVLPCSGARSSDPDGRPQKRQKLSVPLPSLIGSSGNGIPGNRLGSEAILQPSQTGFERRSGASNGKKRAARDGSTLQSGQDSGHVSGDDFSFMKPAWPGRATKRQRVARAWGVKHTGKRKQASIARDPAKLNSAFRASTSPKGPRLDKSASIPGPADQARPSGSTEWSKAYHVPLDVDPARTPTPESEVVGSGGPLKGMPKSLQPAAAPEGIVLKRPRGRPKGSGVKKAHARASGAAGLSKAGGHGRTAAALKVATEMGPNPSGGTVAPTDGAGDAVLESSYSLAVEPGKVRAQARLDEGHLSLVMRGIAVDGGHLHLP
eukprot:jgi/Botrbrau1/18483/Bobra.0072s0063.1